MSTFHDFLVWFDGWAENIDGTPTEKQWTRLKAKVAEVRSATPQPAAVIVHERNGVQTAGPLPPAEPRKPTNLREWKAEFTGRLIEQGVDLESARDILDGYCEEMPNIDITTDPRHMADMAYSRTMN